MSSAKNLKSLSIPFALSKKLLGSVHLGRLVICASNENSAARRAEGLGLGAHAERVQRSSHLAAADPTNQAFAPVVLAPRAPETSPDVSVTVSTLRGCPGVCTQIGLKEVQLFQLERQDLLLDNV